MTWADLFNFVTGNASTIRRYSETHFILVLETVIVSLILWVPLGLLLSKSDKWAGRVMALANLIFCIPSLSLFAIFVTIPGLGLGRRSSLLALVLYAMMPLLRNVYDGVKNVDRSVIEAAKGMGMSEAGIIREIRFPLGLPVIFAGFRITVVMTTGMATIASFIGEQNLGRFITNGMVRNNTEMLVTGAVLISVIAVVLDTILGLLEKGLIPRGLRLRR
ncbi:Binding-protein-dependent transport system inner membrane component [Acididesulfobacillus acetoxydans]|uniref:Binding-protein-dependent transport system inner membrane component n=1 Tax=Acididesulfobacillus acetoxydans TaxID=1561005 RepID=A0A8S0WF11_9FIRM|nr:ABC transporter permease [Acididesulfobacillus acetoxydans]CAA7600562.1 Binding-protein-dependent transport system inner membrane component [Acididesulfobacillus acetoxydans]CEJ06696.1 Choline transport system permease protein OpuBB [Acididesulfobacillus acetoxydans]